VTEIAALVMAHAGHWAVSLAYTVPVIGMILWLAVSTMRERKRERLKPEPSPPVSSDQED
jgi:hypothetical protein